MWRRSTWCSCPQVSPSRTAPLPVRRNVQEPRLGAGPQIGRTLGRWSAFPYKARPRGEEPGSGRPRSCQEAGARGGTLGSAGAQ